MDIKEFAGGLAVINGEVYEKIGVRRVDSGRVTMEYIPNINLVESPKLTRIIRITNAGLKEVYENFNSGNISEIHRMCECDDIVETFTNGYIKGIEAGVRFLNGKTSIYTPAVIMNRLGFDGVNTYYIHAVLASKDDTYYVKLTSHNVTEFMANVDHYMGVKYDKICDMFKDGAKVIYHSNPYDEVDEESLIDSVLKLLASDKIIDTLRKPKRVEYLTSDLSDIVVQ